MLYLFLKFLHVIGVILWIGPPLGAYYVLYRAHQTEDRETILWAERITERILLVEHVALAVLVGSGLAIVQQSGWALLAVPWLKKKLMLFAGVIVFELYDIWFAHLYVRKLLASPDASWAEAQRLRRILIFSALPVGLVLIPGILWFAIAKQ